MAAMTFLPIVDRELRVASRKRSTYWSRVVAATVGLGIGGWILLVSRDENPSSAGKFLFITLSVVLSIYSAGGGVRLTADCLSEEKREGTMGLLFLTDLKGYDIILGKLFATSLSAVYSILALFPIMALPLLMGGVTAAEFWRVALVCLNLIFFSLAVGMFGSSLCRDERRALSLSVLIILGFLAGPPVIGMYMEYKLNHFESACFIPSPAYPCFLAHDVFYKMRTSDFWIASALTHAYGWLFLGAASRIVPRTWQDRAVSSKASRRQDAWNNLAQGNQKQRKALRDRLLSINPFFWLAGRARFRPHLVWLMLALSTGLWFWGYFKMGRTEWMNEGNYIFTAIVLHSLLKFWLTSEACRRFVEDRQTGAMELLLSTPLSVAEILHGQRLALARQFLGPVLAVVFVDLIFLLLGLNNPNMRGDDALLWVMTWAAGAFVFLMDLNTLSWVSMWAGLTCRRVNQAAGAAISRILFLPWLVFVGLLSLLSFATVVGFSWSGDWAGPGMILAWFLISVTNNIFFGGWARRRTHSQFREIATSRFDQAGKRSIWKTFSRSKPNPDLPPVIVH